MLVSGIGYLKYLPSNGGILSSSYSSSESEMVVSGDGSRTSLQTRLRVILGHILSLGMLRCEWFIAGGFSCLNIVFGHQVASGCVKIVRVTVFSLADGFVKSPSSFIGPVFCKSLSPS